eukprot:5026831-Amphidinium_carterae.1
MTPPRAIRPWLNKLLLFGFLLSPNPPLNDYWAAVNRRVSLQYVWRIIIRIPADWRLQEFAIPAGGHRGPVAAVVHSWCCIGQDLTNSLL